MEKIVTAALDLDVLMAAYSAGRMGRREIEQASGLWFGQILQEMAHRHLPLPRVDARQHYNLTQQRLFERVFG